MKCWHCGNEIEGAYYKYRRATVTDEGHIAGIKVNVCRDCAADMIHQDPQYWRLLTRVGGYVERNDLL